MRIFFSKTIKNMLKIIVYLSCCKILHLCKKYCTLAIKISPNVIEDSLSVIIYYGNMKINVKMTNVIFWISYWSVKIYLCDIIKM